MNAGEKAIAKEMRRQEQERRKQLQLANKMLIPVSKKTSMTLEMISFDPSGVFFLNENRWLKIFTLEGDIEKIVAVLKNLSGRIRITLRMGEDGGRATCHLSLMETGEMYDEVRQKMMKDVAVLEQVVNLHPLDIDSAMNQIALNFHKDIRFSYASYVRGNKDWKKEVFGEVKEVDKSFSMEGFYGESFHTLAFPTKTVNGLISQLEGLMCPMYLSVDLNSLTEEEHTDFKRAIEKRYNKRLPVNSEESFINLSLSAVIICDSNDARKILEETIQSVFLGHGIIITPSFHMQRAVAESMLSLGLLDQMIMRNVSTNVAELMLGGEEDADAKIKV